MNKYIHSGWLEDLLSKQLDGHLFAADAARLERHAASIKDLALFGLLTQSELDRIHRRLAVQIRKAVLRHDHHGLRDDSVRKGVRK